MKMVVTLKSGVQIKADVEDSTIGRSPIFGELRELKWTSTERPDVRIQWLDMGEVAAVHAEFDWDGVDAAPEGGMPVQRVISDMKGATS